MDDKKNINVEVEEELELTDEQAARMDELDNAAHEYLKVLLNDPDLEWNQEYIGGLNDIAAEMMHRKGFKIYYPAVVTKADGSQVREDFYNSDVANGILVDGAYWNSERFGGILNNDNGKMSVYQIRVTAHDSGVINIWAHDEKEALDIADNLNSHELKVYRSCDNVGTKAEIYDGKSAYEKKGEQA